MKNLFKNLFATLLIIGLTNSIAFSQTKFEKATSDPGKLEKQVFKDWPRERGKNGKGYTVYYPALKTPPKKVALVSFAIHDPGNKKENAKSISSTRMSVESAKTMVNSYLGVSIEPLKKTYKEYGMELLTPDEFLDTDEKKEFYNNFVLEKRNKGHKMMNNIASAGTSKNITLSQGAEGYRELIPREEMMFIDGKHATKFNMSDCKDPKMMEGLGYELCNALEVDAVVVIYNTVMEKKNTLKYVSMAMFGPNPIELADGKKDGPLYRKGLYYGVFRIKIDKSSKDKKNPVVGTVTNGYENIMIALSKNMGEWLKEETAKEDKR